MNKIKISFKDYARIRISVTRSDKYNLCSYIATCFIFTNNINGRPKAYISHFPKAYCRFTSMFREGEKIRELPNQSEFYLYKLIKFELKDCFNTYIHTPWSYGNYIKDICESVIYFRVPIYHLSLTTRQIPKYYSNDKRLMSLIREILIKIGQSVTSAIVNGVEET